MLNKRGKTIVFVLITAVGAALLAYGLFGHTTGVSASSEGAAEPNLVAKTEPELIKDVSVGGVRRDESGKLEQTYEQGAKPPKACPT